MTAGVDAVDIVCSVRTDDDNALVNKKYYQSSIYLFSINPFFKTDFVQVGGKYGNEIRSRDIAVPYFAVTVTL
jgi:hypothetical protein